MTPAYTTVLFDLDHTLLDSDASEALAFDGALRSIGIDDPRAHFAHYDRINNELWRAVERHELTPTVVRVLRFERLLATIGHGSDAALLAETYAAGLGRHGELFPGALDVLDALAGRVRLGLITNGLGDVQRARLERLGILDHFDAVVISAEAGVSKPKAEIFEIAFEQLGVGRDGAIMVGDSFSSDIQGAINARIAACWFNRHGVAASTEHRIDHELRDLRELLPIVLGATAA